MSVYSNLIERLLPREHRVSYSQCGEDLIIDFIFGATKISNPSYLDIGAYHPTDLSNTYFFYRKGFQGVCVEPDPTLFAEIKRVRSRDTCLNVGIGIGQETVADFFIMTTRTLNTFSREEAERYQAFGNQKIEEIIQVPLVPVNKVIEQNFDAHPNLVSLDVEGLDLEVLKTFDFSSFRPEVFCIETLTYSEDNSEYKRPEINELMIANGYIAYADTYINTIFVDRDLWTNR